MSRSDIFWFRYDPRDTVVATGWMTLAQKGAHHALLEIAWVRLSCSVPADKAWICTRLQISTMEFEEIVAPVLEALWALEGDPPNAEWVCPWLRERREDAEHRSHKARTSARARHYPDNIHPLKLKGKL
ncbi:YdaU family protein [Limibaculum sp. FT325]|uniref:YdaU family protein n=1 Tax=Thermohalobaculum sediminis TaxID=2939436 RepID=UPI0020BD9D23|nr:YdaU family protein [Limibaculum sediminis]MCL5779257.1 YdaU family protein [Limibaculum sediminis]